MSFTGNWNYPTAIRFGPGRIRELPEACRAVGLARPLLVTDAGLKDLPMIADALGLLDAAGLGRAVFADVRPNPHAENVEAGVAAYRAGGHDGVVAFGGGSALDVGKAVAFLSGQTRPLFDFEDADANWRRADPAGIAPCLAVPTTAGTGSEVGRVSVIGDPATRTKRLIFHPRLQPALVIADPELTLGVPPGITAATGMDALAHCLEAYCAPGFHPLADGVALEGTRLIKEWLPVAVREGGNLEARAAMMAAATMGATAFQKGLGAIHSLAHPLGARTDAHHGLLNGVLMPYVLARNAAGIAERLEVLARVLGLPEAGLPGVLAWIEGLRAEIGIPASLTAAGLADLDRDAIIADALVDPSTCGNPVPLDAALAGAMLDDAIAGQLPT